MPGQLATDFQKISMVNQHLPYTFRKVLNYKPQKVLRGFFGNIINLLLAILLSRFIVPGEITPAGIAFGLTNTGRQLKLTERLIILTGIFLGTLSVKGTYYAAGVTSALLLLEIINLQYQRRRRTSIKRIPFFIAWVLLRLLITVIITPTPYMFLVTGIELTFSLILTVFFQNGFAFLDNPLKTTSKLTLSGLAIIMLMTIGGIKGLEIESYDLANIIATIFLLIVSYIGGGGVGAVMGISIATALGITTENLVNMIATFSMVGFLGGFLRGFKKWGTILGAGLGLYFIFQYLQISPILTTQTLPWGIGMVSFLLIPQRYLSQVSNFLPNNPPGAGSPEAQKQIWEIINNRLNGLSEIFSELAKSFNDNNTQSAPTNQKMDLYSLLDQVCTKNCQHCNGYENCWGENFYATYREIFDLVAYAELYGEVGSKHIKGRLAKNCFQQFKLIATINELFDKCQTDLHWQKKLEESKVFLANQLEGVSGIINNLTAEISTDIYFKTEVEEKLRQGFNRVGMSVKEVNVLAYGDQGLEIKIKQNNCNQKHECQYLAGAMVSRLMDCEYTVWERNCNYENSTCSYSMTPARNYEIKTTICKLPKDGNEFSGDNHALIELKDGHFVTILSDGMGHGSKASVESTTTVTMLEKLLETGVDRNFAVKMVNSVLLLHSPEESFATVDLAIIDLYTARAEFIKIGAAVTYIKRGREVWSIKSTSLPAGILNTVDYERTVVDLQPGDLVIMVTDGVVESKINQPDKEDWMVRALKQVEVVGPEALGEYLLNLAKINQDGIPQDDMTVIVLQILEKCFN